LFTAQCQQRFGLCVEQPGRGLNNPRIIVLCVIDDPDRRKGHFGGTIAGPVVRDVVEQTLNYLGVAPDKTPEAPKSNFVASAH
jgi:hypothetical protein